MFSNIKNSSGRIINWSLFLLILINILNFIITKSLGTLIIPKLQVEKIYTIIIIILLSVILVFIMFELIFKKFTGKLFLKILLFLILFIVHILLCNNANANRAMLTLKNNSGMRLTDITISAPFDEATISHLEVDKTLTIPVSLNVERGILRIKGRLDSGKIFNSEITLIEWWYIKEDLDISVDFSGNIEYKWVRSE